MSAITAYFTDTMVDALREQGVNIASIELASENHKRVTIVVRDASELFNVFAAGIAWRERNLEHKMVESSGL